MRFICLCPTYKKPWSLLEQSLDCFLKQRHKDAFLMIYDDLGAIPAEAHDEWCVISTSKRESGIVPKYRKMLELSRDFGKFDAMALWDDDDIYSPSHLKFHDIILGGHEMSYPSHVWTTHMASKEKDGRRRERSGGRFWASLSIRMDVLNRMGFLETNEMSFDLQNLNRWKRSCSVGDPCSLGEPTYTYRWEDTGCLHASAFARSHNDTEWYERIRKS